MPDEGRPFGRLTNWIPDEWKHPIGMPAGGNEGNTMSVMALVGGRPIRLSLAQPSKA